MKVAIVGCRDAAYLLEQIREKNADYQVVCLGDNNQELHGKIIDELEIVSICDIAYKYNSGEIEGVIITVRKGYHRYCIIQQLQGYGIRNIILLKPSMLTYRLPIVFQKDHPLYEKQWLLCEEEKKPIIQHMETHLADGCNLNCKGCLHFSNLFEREEFPDLDCLLRDIEYIAEKCEIFQFRVLGGEPLLNPRLPFFLERLRQIIPKSDIAVLSNGILIPSMSEELFLTMKRNYIGFNLTVYPPTLKMMDKITNVLIQYGVPYGSHIARTEEFTRFMLLKPNELETTVYTKCESRGIIELYKGRLHKCPLETFVYKYYEKYDLPSVELEGVDIYQKDLDWESLVVGLTAHKGEFCRYCSEEAEMFHWQCGAPRQEDWLVDAEGASDEKA